MRTTAAYLFDLDLLPINPTRRIRIPPVQPKIAVNKLSGRVVTRVTEVVSQLMGYRETLPMNMLFRVNRDYHMSLSRRSRQKYQRSPEKRIYANSKVLKDLLELYRSGCYARLLQHLLGVSAVSHLAGPSTSGFAELQSKILTQNAEIFPLRASRVAVSVHLNSLGQSQQGQPSSLCKLNCLM